MISAMGVVAATNWEVTYTDAAGGQRTTTRLEINRVPAQDWRVTRVHMRPGYGRAVRVVHTGVLSRSVEVVRRAT
jgi:hypothetical protein